MSEQAEMTLEEEIMASEAASAPPESEETQPAEQVESPEPGEEQQPEQTESKEPRDKRIAGYYAERSRAQQLEQELAELRQRQSQPAATTNAPNYDDFDTDVEYFAALAEHKAEQKIEAFKQEQAQRGFQDQRIAAQQNFAKKVAAANIPDYEEKAELLLTSVGLRQDTLEALWEMEGTKGPQLVAYLADNLDIADGISPVKLGELSAKMAAPKPVQQTKAPPVVKPVKGTSTTGKSFDDPDAEFNQDEIRQAILDMED
jgi:hypothetical protein